ncbi:hypothetical protein RIF29_37911 [Crotalaria pallida]|uniref:Uncharacterized protein n=1 Tax=Crotalaria pallida TaxID=3830 RepID=A0AAN9DZ06_CROPI
MFMEGYNPSPKEIIQMVREDLCPMLEEEEKDVDNSEEFDIKPKIEVSLEEYEEWCRPWRKALIVNLVGRKVAFRFLVATLKRVTTQFDKLTLMYLQIDIWVENL